MSEEFYLDVDHKIATRESFGKALASLQDDTYSAAPVE